MHQSPRLNTTKKVGDIGGKPNSSPSLGARVTRLRLPPRSGVLGSPSPWQVPVMLELRER